MTVKQVEKAIENKTTLYFDSTYGGIFSGTPTEIITREPKNLRQDEILQRHEPFQHVRQHRKT